MARPPGVWVTGPSRSGTSMVSGLFAAHGVFFGECINANKYNPKGYFENVYIKKVVKGEVEPEDWPRDWFVALAAQGWCGCDPWGVKVGPQRADTILSLEPRAIVACRRPLIDIAESRRHVHWAQGDPLKVPRAAYQRIGELMRGDVPVVNVEVNDLVEGRFRTIKPAFDLINLDFEMDIAEDWIDPNLWRRNS